MNVLRKSLSMWCEIPPQTGNPTGPMLVARAQQGEIRADNASLEARNTTTTVSNDTGRVMALDIRSKKGPFIVELPDCSALL